MSRTRLTRRLLLLAAILPVAVFLNAAVAQDAPQTEFQRGYFLQTHDGDAAGAAAAFEKVLADRDASAGLRAEAQARLAQCREDLATADLARLMPPEALAYVEVSQPGRHLEQLLKMVGLVRGPNAPAPEAQAKGTPLPEGLFFPEDFTISPSLMAALSKFKAAAVAVTSIDPQREQVEGVAVLHPGSDSLLRGLLETAVQLLEPDEPIDGFKTYQYRSEAWITATSSLLIVGNSRQQVAAAVARLKSPDAESLASQEQFQRCRADWANALLLVYVSGPRMMQQFGPQLSGREAAIARAVLDLDHWESFTVGVGTTEKGIQVETRLSFAPGQRSLAYGLIRTAPLSGRSLEYVPRGAGAVVLLGLNPAAPASAVGTQNPVAKPPVQALTAMNLGRELFANIEEVALFALPHEQGAAEGPAAAEVGLVIAVGDPARSQAVWSQLLTLPALFGLPGAAAPREITIEGETGKVYSFPDCPPIVMLRLKDRALVAGTEAAVTAAVKAAATGNTVRHDASFGPLLGRLGPSTSKAVLVDVGRTAQIVASCQPAGRHSPRMQQHVRQLMMVGSLLKDLDLSAVTQEGPTQLVVRVEATGLPNVPAIIKTLAAAEQRGRPHFPAQTIATEAQQPVEIKRH